MIPNVVSVGSDASLNHVSEVMPSPVIHISSNQSVANGIVLMVNKEIRKILVTDSRKVIDIVTGATFLRLFVESNDEELQKVYQQNLEGIYNNWSIC